jgi:hypothetical protein
MANLNAAYGLKPIEYLSGVKYNGATRRYYKNETSNALYPGDPVQAPGGADVGGYPYVDLAQAGNHTWRGVMAGIDLMVPDQFKVQGYTAATQGYVRVCDEQYLLYAIQESATTSGAAIALSDVENGKLDLKSAAANTTLQQSAWTLDSSTAASQNSGTATGHQAVIKKALTNPQNVFPGAYAQWVIVNANYA